MRTDRIEAKCKECGENLRNATELREHKKQTGHIAYMPRIAKD